MTRYTLDSVNLLPVSKNKPKQIIILCHGYGGSGKDISILANNWKRFLPESIFICPNAPKPCSINLNGFEWFDLSQDKDNFLLEKSLEAERKLNIFIDQILDNFKIDIQNLALVGFSQGCMMVIQTALKKKKQINCLLGYSGKIINQEHLSLNIRSKPKIFLMHGEDDTIVSPNYLLEAKNYLKDKNLTVKTKLFKNCDHRINVEGSSFGLEFLKKNLLY